jgi:hypothetical protein
MGKCGKCNRSISRHDDYLSCSSTCKLDYHVNCCGIDDDELKMLKSAGKTKNWSRHQSSVQPDSADDFLKKLGVAVAARNIFGWVGRHFNVIITFFIMFVVIAGKEFLC